LCQSIGLAVAVRYQDEIQTNTKVVYPLLCYSAVFLATTILVLVTINGDLLFWLTLISTCICGLCGALLSGGLFGLAGNFPSKYTAALMTGQALAGLLVCVSNIVTSLAGGETDVCSDDDANDDCSYSTSYSALAYFIIATVVLISCVGAFATLMRLPITRYTSQIYLLYFTLF
jgi:equilibrative nucleoside transporter 1/2/3